MLGAMNVFDTAPEMQGQIKRGVKPYDLKNLQTTAIKVHLYQPRTNTHKFGKGTITFTDTTNGLFAYSWDSADTNTPGVWDVWVELTDANGKTLSSTNVELLQITNRMRGYSKHGTGRVRVA
jgi:hypothetical protein